MTPEQTLAIMWRTVDKIQLTPKPGADARMLRSLVSELEAYFSVKVDSKSLTQDKT